MALPKEVTFVTFDVYGTLIDWETGAYDAFTKEAERDGYTLSKEELVPLFLETQQEIKGGSYELYAEVLRRTAVTISKQLGWPLEPSRSGFLPESVKRWQPFKETNTLIGRVGVARGSDCVFVDGGLWRARSWGLEGDPPLERGLPVVVEGVTGLTLTVRPAEEWEVAP